MANDAIKSTALIGGLLLAGALINAAAIVSYARADEPGDPRAFYRPSIMAQAGHRAHRQHHARHRHAGPVHVAIVHDGGDPRPRAWCGWFLRHELGVADRAYNLARKWAGYGRPASGPAPGVIAVYPHHVGIVTGVPGPGRMILKSGNDGHAVRERERSTAHVIAWRIP